MAFFRPKNDKIWGDFFFLKSFLIFDKIGGDFFFFKSFLIFGQTTPRNKKNDDTGSVDQFGPNYQISSISL
jgi:hypothetical protein